MDSLSVSPDEGALVDASTDAPMSAFGPSSEEAKLARLARKAESARQARLRHKDHVYQLSEEVKALRAELARREHNQAVWQQQLRRELQEALPADRWQQLEGWLAASALSQQQQQQQQQQQRVLEQSAARRRTELRRRRARARRLKGGGGHKAEGQEDGMIEWLNPAFGSFDDFSSSMLVLYVASTGDGWEEFMFAGMDAVGIDLAPVRGDGVTSQSPSQPPSLSPSPQPLQPPSCLIHTLTLAHPHSHPNPSPSSSPRCATTSRRPPSSSSRG